MGKIKIWGIFFAFAIFLIFLALPVFPSSQAESKFFAVVVTIGFLWLTETMPIGITALLPLILLPILRIDSTPSVAMNYINSTIFLFLGGFILSLAIEKTELHKLFANFLQKILGGSKIGYVLSFTLSAFFLSMFISNTATALIITPMALSALKPLKGMLDERQYNNLTKCVLLSIAYSCSIGGIATIIGTPPNLIFARVYQVHFPNNQPIGFVEWLSINFPLALLFVVLEFLFFYVIFLKKIPNKLLSRNDLQAVAKLAFQQKAVLGIFVATCLLWIFRSDIDLSFFKIPGWSNLLGLGNLVDDGTVAIFATILLFVFPKDKKSIREPILKIGTLKEVPWDIILLFGGGFAIASGFEKTGLSQLLGQKLLGFSDISPFLLILITSSVVVAVTEFSSNTAVASTFLPIIASISIATGVEPMKLLLPATISASLAFMLPVSTPPNAVVFSTGFIKIAEMARYGIALNILGILLVALYFGYLF